MLKNFVAYITVASLVFSPFSSSFGMKQIDEDEQNPRISPQRIEKNDLLPKIIAPQQLSMDLDTHIKAWHKEQKRETYNIQDPPISALIIYTLKHKNYEFLEKLDKDIFTETSRWEITGKVIIGAVGGGITPIFLSNLVESSIGNILNTHINPYGSLGMELWLTISTAPAAFRTAYNFGGDLILNSKKIICTGICKSGKSLDKDEVELPKTQPISKAEFGTLALLGISNILNAAIPTVLMVYEERFFPVAARLCIPYMFLFYGANYWDIGRENIRHLFNYYSYQDEVDKLKRIFLKRNILYFLEIINTSSESAKSIIHHVYNTIYEKQRKKAAKGTFSREKEEVQENEEIVSLFSLLLINSFKRKNVSEVMAENIVYMKEEINKKKEEEKTLQNKIERKINNEKEMKDVASNSHRFKQRDDWEDGEENEENEKDPLKDLQERLHSIQLNRETLKEDINDFELKQQLLLYENFRTDVYSLKRPSWKEDLLDRLSTGFTVAAYYARLEILRYTVEQPLIAWGVDPETAKRTAYIIAGCESLFRAFIEAQLHKQQFKEWLGAFSLKGLGTLKWWRKVSNGGATLNGLLFASPTFLVGLKAFSGTSLLYKIATLVPSVGLDISLYTSIFKKRQNEVITGTARIKKDFSREGNCTSCFNSTCCGPELSLALKRTHINAWAQRIIDFIENKADKGTVEKLYELTQYAK